MSPRLVASSKFGLGTVLFLLQMDILFGLGESSELDAPAGAAGGPRHAAPARKHRRTHGNGPGHDHETLKRVRLHKRVNELEDEKDNETNLGIDETDELQLKLNGTSRDIARMRCGL